MHTQHPSLDFFQQKQGGTEVNLPRLVFCERHDDPSNNTLLIALVAKLKERGYNTFFAEMPARVMLGDYQLDKFSISPERKFLMQKILEKRLIYSSIDLDILHKITMALGPNQSIYNFHYDLKDIRDAKLGSAYLYSQGNTFGWLGIGHAPGVQQCLRTTLGEEAAREQFVFIYTYNSHGSDFHENVFPPEGTKKMYPLGMIYIDLSRVDLESACAQILNRVKNTKINPLGASLEELNRKFENEAYQKLLEICTPENIRTGLILRLMQALISARTAPINIENGLLTILNYIANRDWDGKEYTGSSFGSNKSTKINAAFTFIDYLLKKADRGVLTEDELKALHGGRLGKIISNNPDLKNALKEYEIQNHSKHFATCVLV